MEKKSSPPVSLFIPASILMILAGWAGLVYLILYLPPTVWPRWLFFFLTVTAVTGTTLPMTAFLNRRFPTTPPPTSGVVLREAVLIGGYGATLAWMLSGGVLTLPLALLLAAGLFIIEWLLRLRELSQWKP